MKTDLVFSIGQRCSLAFGDVLTEETYLWLRETKPDLHEWLCNEVEDWDIVAKRDESIYDYDTGMGYFFVLLHLYRDEDAVHYKLRWM